MGQSNWVYLENVFIVRVTEKALFARLEDGDSHWFPFSQVEDPDRLNTGDECTLGITEWIAKKNGIETD
jgi:hypothetical protein